MDTKTTEALDASIAHWRRLSTKNRLPREFVYGDDCALCHMFNRRQGCHECPVKKRTGFNSCHGTPWKHARNAAQYAGYDSPLFLLMASRMHSFLIDLYPTKGT